MPDPDLKTISATEISAVLELPDAYESRWMIWQRFRGMEIPPIVDNERMEWGRRLERPILEAVRDRYKLDVRRNDVDAYYRHPVHRVGCTTDGHITCPTRGEGIVESKNVDWVSWRTSWQFDEADECIAAPPRIEVQLAHQMLACEARWGIIAALVGGNQLILLERRRDAQIENAILYAVEQFFEDVAIGKEPDVLGTPREIAALQHLYPVLKENPVLDLSDAVDGQELESLVTDYQSTSELRLRHDKTAKALKAKILQSLKDHAIAELPGGTLRVSQKGRRITYK